MEVFGWALILVKTDDFREVHLIQYSENHPEGNIKFPGFVQHKTRHVTNFESFILSNDEIENINLKSVSLQLGLPQGVFLVK